MHVLRKEQQLLQPGIVVQFFMMTIAAAGEFCTQMFVPADVEQGPPGRFIPGGRYEDVIVKLRSLPFEEPHELPESIRKEYCITALQNVTGAWEKMSTEYMLSTVCKAYEREVQARRVRMHIRIGRRASSCKLRYRSRLMCLSFMMLSYR